MEFTYNFKVNAKDKDTSVKVMNALTKLAKSISPDDLKMLAEKIEANPGLIETAKKFL